VHVSLGKINELSLGLSSRDDVSPVVLHSLGSLSLDFSGNDDLSTLCNTGSLDHVEDLIDDHSDWVSSKELPLDVLSLP